MPDPVLPKVEKKGTDLLEWTVVVYPQKTKVGEESDSPQSVLQRSTSRRGLGETPLLWNDMRGQEYPTEKNDGS